MLLKRAQKGQLPLVEAVKKLQSQILDATTGEPRGVSVDLARELATRLNVPIGDPSRADQEYVWISNASNLPLFVERVYPGLEAAQKALNVKVRIAGPTSVDLAAFITTVDAECTKNPAGAFNTSVTGLSAGVDRNFTLDATNTVVQPGACVYLTRTKGGTGVAMSILTLALRFRRI